MFADMVKNAMKTTENPGDYIENGVLMCGKCRTAKQVLLSLPALTGTDTPQPFPISCLCQKQADELAEKQRQEQAFSARMARLWAGGVHDPELLRWRFEDDDGGQDKTAGVARRYCEKWPDMLQNNMGILLFGPVGTGKSFIASCICNEILKQHVPLCATSFARILNVLQSSFDGRQETHDRLGRFQLLFLDDLGAERSTEFSLEQVFSVIDSRYRTKKPVVITTNLTLKQIENPENLAYSRIFDRVLEMCPIRLCVSGSSRRQGLAGSRRALARELLLGEGGDVQ